MASSGDKTCRLWDVHRCTVISTFRHRADVESVDVKPGDESCIVSGDISGCASVWDLRTDPGKGPTHTFTDSNGSDLNSVAYFPDGNYFAAGGEDAVVTLYDLRAYKPIQTFTDPKLTPRNDVSCYCTRLRLTAPYSRPMPHCCHPCHNRAVRLSSFLLPDV